jgi:hypothetical protein
MQGTLVWFVGPRSIRLDNSYRSSSLHNQEVWIHQYRGVCSALALYELLEYEH